MNSGPKDARLQGSGCQLLAHLGRRNDANKQEIVNDGIALIIAAMDNHVRRHDVQESGCNVLEVLTSTTIQDYSKDQYIRSEGIRQLLVAMVNHVEVPAIHCYAIKALHHLTVSEPNKDLKAIVDCRGIKTIFTVMNKNIENVKVQKEVLIILELFASTSKGCRTNINAEGGVESIFKAIKQHPDAMDMIVNACKILFYMIKKDGNKTLRNIHEANGNMQLIKSAQNSEELKDKNNILEWLHSI